jgi:parallel beta-helix repeat protein
VLVTGASDAGIYVGQSNDIIVVDSEASENVAGIEIENSHRALVVRNWAHDNTGGILVFDLPGLEQYDGSCTEVVDNLIENNNAVNFAPGGVVQTVPRGTGMLLLASDRLNIHDNRIIGNNGPATMVINYDPLVFDAYEDENFDPWPRGNWIHDNTFEGNGTDPQGYILDLVQGVNPIPDLVWDGCYENPDAVPDEDRYCATGNMRDDGSEATFVNVRLCDGFQDKVFDVETVNCEIPETLSCGVPDAPED